MKRKIMVEFDEAQQVVGLSFDNEQIKTWDYVVAILGMAQDQAKTERSMALARGAQARAQREMQDQIMRKTLKLG